jgi:uncharacterized integral membrane protein
VFYWEFWEINLLFTKKGETMKTKTIILLSSIILLLILLFQNAQTVVFRIFFWKIEMSRIIMFLLILILGFISGYITAKLTGKKTISKEQ